MSSRVIPGHFKAGLIQGVPPKVSLAIDFLEHFIQRPCALRVTNERVPREDASFSTSPSVANPPARI
jgi:hypothetical protein